MYNIIIKISKKIIRCFENRFIRKFRANASLLSRVKRQQLAVAPKHAFNLLKRVEKRGRTTPKFNLGLDLYDKMLQG